MTEDHIKKVDTDIPCNFSIEIYQPKHMRTILTIALLYLTYATGCSQDEDNSSSTPVGGRCEGCEAVFEYKHRDKPLTWIDTLPDFHEPGPKLELTGTIYKRDGRTPAKDVILYIYHTDQTGEYTANANEQRWGKKHGSIRGWIRTNADGKYKFYTLKPGAYPGGGNPQHIHPIIKEPGVKEYWIDEYLFDDDPILTDSDRERQPGRGGSGILKTKKDKNGMLVAHRNIILGLNVPGYEAAP
jgi:protocatechuate 3,4-dioxygenase beta subunit